MTAIMPRLQNFRPLTSFCSVVIILFALMNVIEAGVIKNIEAKSESGHHENVTENQTAFSVAHMSDIEPVNSDLHNNEQRSASMELKDTTSVINNLERLLPDLIPTGRKFVENSDENLAKDDYEVFYKNGNDLLTKNANIEKDMNLFIENGGKIALESQTNPSDTTNERMDADRQLANELIKINSKLADIATEDTTDLSTNSPDHTKITPEKILDELEKTAINKYKIELSDNQQFLEETTMKTIATTVKTVESLENSIGTGNLLKTTGTIEMRDSFNMDDTSERKDPLEVIESIEKNYTKNEKVAFERKDKINETAATDEKLQIERIVPVERKDSIDMKDKIEMKDSIVTKDLIESKNIIESKDTMGGEDSIARKLPIDRIDTIEGNDSIERKDPVKLKNYSTTVLPNTTSVPNKNEMNQLKTFQENNLTTLTSTENLVKKLPKNVLNETEINTLPTGFGPTAQAQESNEIRLVGAKAGTEKRAKFINSTNLQQLNFPKIADTWIPIVTKLNMMATTTTEATNQNYIKNSQSEKNLLDWTQIMMNGELNNSKQHSNLLLAGVEDSETMKQKGIMETTTNAPIFSTQLPNNANEIVTEQTLFKKPQEAHETLKVEDKQKNAEEILSIDKDDNSTHISKSSKINESFKTLYNSNNNNNSNNTVVQLAATTTTTTELKRSEEKNEKHTKTVEEPILNTIAKPLTTTTTTTTITTANEIETVESTTTATKTTTATVTAVASPALPKNHQFSNNETKSEQKEKQNDINAYKSDVTLNKTYKQNNSNATDNNYELEQISKENSKLSIIESSKATTTANAVTVSNFELNNNWRRNEGILVENEKDVAVETTTTPTPTAVVINVLTASTAPTTTATVVIATKVPTTTKTAALENVITEVNRINNELESTTIKSTESPAFIGTTSTTENINTPLNGIESEKILEAATATATATAITTTSTAAINEAQLLITSEKTKIAETTTTGTVIDIGRDRDSDTFMSTSIATPIIETNVATQNSISTQIITTTTAPIVAKNNEEILITENPKNIAITHDVTIVDILKSHASNNKSIPATKDRENALETNIIEPVDLAKKQPKQGIESAKIESEPTAQEKHVKEMPMEENLSTLSPNANTEDPLINLLDDTTTPITTTTTTTASIVTKSKDIYVIFTSTTTPPTERSISTTESTITSSLKPMITLTDYLPTSIPVLSTTTISPVLGAAIRNVNNIRKFPNPTDFDTDTNLQPNASEPHETDVNVIVAITVSVIGVVALILLVAFLYLIRKRQKQMSYGQRCRPVSLDAYSLDNVSVLGSVRRKSAMRASKRSYGNIAFDDPSLRHNVLNSSELSKFLERRSSIFEEFRDVPQIVARADEVPPGCEDKNRYANVIPLPETRVILQQQNNDEKTEYINANYVRGPRDAPNYYIACQAPIEITVIDFWRMIWEQQSRVIIQATDLIENGIEKCAEYLPPSVTLDNHTTYGDFQVTLKHREVKDKYAISTILLKNTIEDAYRELTHYWYKWPETGVPNEEAPLIAMLLEVRSSLKSYAIEQANELKEKSSTLTLKSADSSSNDDDVVLSTINAQGSNNKQLTTDTNKVEENAINNTIELNGNLSLSAEKLKTTAKTQGPLTVHCSPGTGRTGTIIACDMAIRSLEIKRNVDIPQIVYYVRRGRASAVQTKEQYEFIYKVASMYATKITNTVNDS